MKYCCNCRCITQHFPVYHYGIDYVVCERCSKRTQEDTEQTRAMVKQMRTIFKVNQGNKGAQPA